MDAELSPRAKDAGLTLIELLVAIAVLAALAVGAGLLLPRAGESDAARFARSVETARQTAILTGTPRALRITPTRVTPLTWAGTGWQTDGPALTLGTPAALAGDPLLILLPDGRSTSVSLQLGRIRCTSDGWTRLTCSGV